MNTRGDTAGAAPPKIPRTRGEVRWCVTLPVLLVLLAGLALLYPEREVVAQELHDELRTVGTPRPRVRGGRGGGRQGRGGAWRGGARRRGGRGGRGVRVRRAHGGVLVAVLVEGVELGDGIVEGLVG